MTGIIKTLSKSIRAVSYTHLDVYKRQPVDVGLTVNVNPPAGKTPVEISGLTVSNKTYDLKPVTVEGTPIVTGGYNPEQHGKLTYTWQKDDGRVLSEPPTDRCV